MNFVRVVYIRRERKNKISGRRSPLILVSSYIRYTNYTLLHPFHSVGYVIENIRSCLFGNFIISEQESRFLLPYYAEKLSLRGTYFPYCSLI